MNTEQGRLAKYIEAALIRIESAAIDSPQGSHLAGVYGKAAQGFESAMKESLAQMLAQHGLDYRKDIQPNLVNGPAFSRLTLGAIRACFQLVKDVTAHGCVTEEFMSDMDQANRVWVDGVKHGKEMTRQHAIAGLKSMRQCLAHVES